jgi:hypothetical protein
MTKYEIRKDEEGNDLLFKIEENGKEWSVPMIEGNSDYAAYLNPKAEQSTPMVTDETKTI